MKTLVQSLLKPLFWRNIKKIIEALCFQATSMPAKDQIFFCFVLFCFVFFFFVRGAWDLWVSQGAEQLKMSQKVSEWTDFANYNKFTIQTEGLFWLTTTMYATSNIL